MKSIDSARLAFLRDRDLKILEERADTGNVSENNATVDRRLELELAWGVDLDVKGTQASTAPDSWRLIVCSCHDGSL